MSLNRNKTRSLNEHVVNRGFPDPMSIFLLEVVQYLLNNILGVFIKHTYSWLFTSVSYMYVEATNWMKRGTMGFE